MLCDELVLMRVKNNGHKLIFFFKRMLFHVKWTLNYPLRTKESILIKNRRTV